MCDVRGCPNKSIAIPVISFTAKGYPDGPRAEMKYHAAVCFDHMVGDPNLYVTDEVWEKICGVMLELGLAQPDRDSLQLRHEMLGAN